MIINNIPPVVYVITTFCIILLIGLVYGVFWTIHTDFEKHANRMGYRGEEMRNKQLKQDEEKGRDYLGLPK